MDIVVLQGTFSVCRLVNLEEINPSSFTFLSITDNEISYVCPTEHEPLNVQKAERGWSAMRIEGTLDFALVGILANITRILADAGISVFAISTYDTDYILVKSDCLTKAISALKGEGYSIIRR